MPNVSRFPAEVFVHSALTKTIFELKLRYPDAIGASNPGQFVNVYLDRKDLLLPRPISICRRVDGVLTLVYAVVGKGTEELSRVKPGDYVSVSSPLGNGFTLPQPDQTLILIGGGVGVPPLLELAVQAKAQGNRVIAALGFREEPILLKAFQFAGVDVFTALERENPRFAGVPNGISGNVVDLLTAHLADWQAASPAGVAIYACGPKPMLKALQLFLVSRGLDGQFSLEERMACGYGACVGCTCALRSETGEIMRKRVCTDGPVFQGKELSFDV